MKLTKKGLNSLISKELGKYYAGEINGGSFYLACIIGDRVFNIIQKKYDIYSIELIATEVNKSCYRGEGYLKFYI